MFSCRIITTTRTVKKSSRRPSQQVLVDMHQRPALVQCTAGQCWRSQTCRVGLEASTPCLDPSLAPSLYPSIPPALSLSTLQPSQAQSVSARSPKLVPLMSEMEQMTRGRVWRGPPPKPLLGNKKTIKKKIKSPKMQSRSGFEISLSSSRSLDSIPLRFLPPAFQCS